mmetsp:Transcript_29154/g.72685  ORF Transcript_29154/g.72685 Transcript_29154/m.72685 type:complete len:249 (+) Transcript_29154:948-1694(+)
MLRTPTCPGTTTRSGKPWSAGTASPFISYASSTSPAAARAFSLGMEAFVPSSPSKWTWRSLAATSASLRSSPHSRSTCESRTPPHSAFDIAPAPHALPEVFATRLNSARRLPPHCSVAATSTRGIARSSASVKERGESPTPETSSVKLCSSRRGTGWWWRTNHSALGVSQESPRSEGGHSAEHGVSLSTRSAGWRGGSAAYGSSAFREAAAASAAAAAEAASSHPICSGARSSATAGLGTPPGARCWR